MDDLKDFARLVRDMRRCQQEYFRTRDNTRLAAARDMERRVDKAVELIFNPPQPGLLDGENL